MTRTLTCLLLALLLAGCTDIQTSGPVQEVPLGSEQLGVQFAPEPPPPGVTPIRLVEGFVQAMADPEANYAVAREYLTRDAAAEWAPGGGGVVYIGEVIEDDEGVQVSGTRAGVVDEDGRFAATDEELIHDFGVVEIGGEWRIGTPPDGLLISDYIFERYWSHSTIYFMAGLDDHVVPDLIHVPDALLTPNRIVEAQIAGPSPMIEASVRNLFGSRGRLAREGASVGADGTATVALTGLDPNMPDARRRLLGAQLLWSLTAIPRVTGLRITNNDEAFPLPGQTADGVFELSSQQGYQQLSRAATSDLFGIRDGVAGQVGVDDSFLPMDTGEARVADVAVAVDRTLVGYIDEDRKQVLVGPWGGELIAVSTGWSNLRSAQFSLGHLWMLGDDAAGDTNVLRVDAQGTVTQVDAGEIPGTMVDFSITQAGARLAAVVERAGTRQLVMASLVGGAAPRLVLAMDLPLVFAPRSTLDDYRSLDWSGETELVVVAGVSGGRSVFRTRLDGSLVEELGLLTEDPVQVSALPRPSGDEVVARSEDGTVLRHDVSGRWSRVQSGLQEVSYPG